MLPRFEGLCISGGGSKGQAHIGALEFCFQNGLLDHIQAYSGTSVGSILCTLLCCGFTPSEIYAQSLAVDLTPDPKDVDFINFFSNCGLINFRKFTEELRVIIRKKIDISPTFKQLYELTKKDLFIASTNITKNEIVYFSHHTYPDLDIIEAIKMSCNLPWIFTKIEFEDDLYIDGGISDHVPYSVLGTAKNILSISTPSNTISELDKFGTFIKYSFDIILHPIKKLESYQRGSAGKNCFFIDIPISEGKLLNVIMSTDEKEKLWMKGYSAASTWKEWLWDQEED